MIYFNKLFKLPGPKDLGMSDSNYAMASEWFRNNSTEETWESYFARVKKLYPIKYFFASTLPQFFIDAWRKFIRRPKDFYYYLKCTFLPSYRFHLIDIREEKSENNILPYRYGWIDSDHKIVLALFKILCDFVEKEAPKGYYIPTEEDVIRDPSLKNQRDKYFEIMEIYNYWKKDRFILDKEYDKLLTTWSKSCKASKGDSNPETDKLWNDMQLLKEKKDEKLDEMLIKLVKIRGCLWT